MALLIYAPFSAAPWLEALRAASPELDIRVWPDIGNPSDVTAALVWKPDIAVFKSLPRLKVVLSMGAGVDHVLSQGQLPNGVRLARIVDDGLSAAMSQYICYHVIRYYRQFDMLAAAQRERRWTDAPVLDPHPWNVGFLGFGVLGSHCASVLTELGFEVSAFVRSPRASAAVRTFSEGQFGEFLSDLRVLVCLLPLTPKTTGILNKDVFDALPRGACLISVGRGPQQVESDIIAALSDGRLSEATLDVFNEEPLPQSSPLWTHPKVVVTPHCAADPSPSRVASTIIENIGRAERGVPLLGQVDLARGY